MKNALANAAKKAGVNDMLDAMFSFFIERVRNNLHIILCMSPVGDPFRSATKCKIVGKLLPRPNSPLIVLDTS